MRVGATPRQVATESGASGEASEVRSRGDSPLLILAIGGVLALGVVLRFVCQSDLWADEVLSVNIAKLPISQISAALRHDGSPPLYYLLLHVWMRIFGTGDSSVRALSGLAGVIAFVPMWFVGRRIDERRIRLGVAPPGSRTVAWSALLLLAMSPFAIRYSTEARMYSFIILWVLVGYLVVVRAFERPTIARLLPVSVVTSLLLYTHYWTFSLLGITGLTMLIYAWRGAPGRRRAAAAVIGALGVGALTFLPWWSSFRFQLAHTGTPWGAPAGPFVSWATAFKAFGGNAHPAGWALVALVLLGLFAKAVDARHIEFDVATRPGVRVEALIAVATFSLGLAIARLSGTTFEGRYAAVVFPMFLLVGAVGIAIFSDARVRIGLLVCVLVLGAWGGASNVRRNRTQAYQLVPIIRDHAAAGDVVLYCPDAIGTDVVGRLRTDVRSISLPNFTSPERVDWVDYAQRVRSIHPADFANRVVRLAGPHSIWFVYTNNGTAADQQCANVADFLTLHRPGRVRELEPNPYFFEHQGLYLYPPTS